MANQHHKIEVDIKSGPPGAMGFRRGYWNVTVDGKRYRMFASIPDAEPDRQCEFLTERARHCLTTGRGLEPTN
jgi:hypothetical protein